MTSRLNVYFLKFLVMVTTRAWIMRYYAKRLAASHENLVLRSCGWKQLTYLRRVRHSSSIPSLPDGRARVFHLGLFVCLVVCLSVRMRNSKTIAPVDLNFITHEGVYPWLGLLLIWPGSGSGFFLAKTITKFRAWIGAQLTICAQYWCNFVCSSMLSLRFVWNWVCVLLYSIGPWTPYLPSWRQWCGIANEGMQSLLCSHQSAILVVHTHSGCGVA